jgi:hypothetical protein
MSGVGTAQKLDKILGAAGGLCTPVLGDGVGVGQQRSNFSQSYIFILCVWLIIQGELNFRIPCLQFSPI